MNQQFEKQWREKVRKVRSSSYWREVSEPPSGRIDRSVKKAGADDVVVDGKWVLVEKGQLSSDGPARIGMDDLAGILSSHFDIHLRRGRDDSDRGQICFELVDKGGTNAISRWDTSFRLDVGKNRIRIEAGSEAGLLQGSVYVSNYWRLRRNPCMPAGQRTIKPTMEIHIGTDLWGGFCTTQAWIEGREADTNFLELARMGVNALPIVGVLENYIESAPGPFGSLIHPQAKSNRQRLARLARQAGRYGVYVFLVGYNPKLRPDHPLFEQRPQARGALQFDNAFRVLCSSDRATREFLAESWASLFEEIPDLGGMLALVGGEGFYHCFMRSTQRDAGDCPRCAHRTGPEVVAELVNEVARGIRGRNPEARMITWPYSAGHWSHDRDQEEFIGKLDRDAVIFQTEIDKDSVDWRAAGYGKECWDYSASQVRVSDRCRRQRRLCRVRNLDFSCKLQMNNSIECLSVPYLPTFQNQLTMWEQCRRLRPRAVQSRWLFSGTCKSPAEELGYWAIWGRGSAFEDLAGVLRSIAGRDFGESAGRYVLGAWELFSQAMRHHPSLDYYVGSYFIGPGQPLVLKGPSSSGGAGVYLEWMNAPLKSVSSAPLDEAFFGQFYWLWEQDATDDPAHLTGKQPLFYSRPGFRATVRRGAPMGGDVALEELQALAKLWDKGIGQLEKAKPLVAANCRRRFQQEWILARHLGYTWESAAHVEEFLRLRDGVVEFSGRYHLRSGHVRENLRDLKRMETIARAELQIARKELALIKGVDFLDLSLRLDMGVESLESIMTAKIQQVKQLLAEELPNWRKQLLTW